VAAIQGIKEIRREHGFQPGLYLHGQNMDLVLRAEHEPELDVWTSKLERVLELRGKDSEARAADADEVAQMPFNLGLVRGLVTPMPKPAVSRTASAASSGTSWMHNSAVSSCFECHTAFTLFNRRHHCR